MTLIIILIMAYYKPTKETLYVFCLGEGIASYAKEALQRKGVTGKGVFTANLQC